MTWRRGLAVFVAVFVVGWGIFGALVWRSSRVSRLDDPAARAAFAEIRARYPGAAPMLVRTDEGGYARAAADSLARPGVRPRSLRIMVWRAPERRLATTTMPMWWFKLKEPVFKFMLRRADVDLDRLALRPRDLEDLGAGLVLDEAFANGDRLLVWTE